jgi:hypothetical protein
MLAFAAQQSQPVGEGVLAEAFGQARALIQEAKGAEWPMGGFITDHLDFAEHWLNKAEEIALSATQAPVGEGALREALEASQRILRASYIGTGSLGGSCICGVQWLGDAETHAASCPIAANAAALQSPASQPVEGIQHVADKIAAGIDRAHCEAGARGLPASQPVETDEYMSVSLSRDGVVTSHNAFDADFDEMVVATETIVRELQRRLSDRKFCPYSHGAELRKTAPASQPNREAVLREDTAFSISKRRHEEKRCVTNDRLREALERIAALNRREISSAGVAMRAIQIASAALTPAADLTGSGEK